MSRFVVTANELIPANRLVVLTVGGKSNNDEIRVRLAKFGEAPDFLASREIKKDEKVTVNISNNLTWSVESAEDIRAGVSVGVSDDGRLIEALTDDNTVSIGYSTQSGVTGDIVDYVRNVKYRILSNEGVSEVSSSTSSVSNEEYPKHVGGGYYELSNGDKVQGKDKALESEKSLQE